MKVLLFILSCFIALAMWPITVLSGQIKIWEDENGITHIEIVGTKTKSNPESMKKLIIREREKLEEKRIRLQEDDIGKQKKYIEHLKRQKEKLLRKKVHLEKEEFDIEFETVKNRYELLKSRQETYRKNYRQSKLRKYRNYWKEKLDSVDEAQKEYELMKHRRRFQKNKYN